MGLNNIIILYMPSLKKRSSSRKYSRIFKENIFAGAGTFLGIVPQFIFGMLLLLSGIYLMRNSKKKEDKNSDNDSIYFYVGIFLAIIGSAFCFGLGFGYILDGILNE